MTKILIAEDEEDIRDLIHFNLFKEKFETIVCADGEAALQKIRETKPDLCLLDIMMPKVDGVEVCRIIRSKREFDEMGVVMLTAKGTEAFRYDYKNNLVRYMNTGNNTDMYYAYDIGRRWALFSGRF